MPEVVKQQVNSVILKSLRRDPLTGILGTLSPALAQPKKRPREAPEEGSEDNLELESDSKRAKKDCPIESSESENDEHMESFDTIPDDDSIPEISMQNDSAAESSRTSSPEPVQGGILKDQWYKVTKPCHVVIKRKFQCNEKHKMKMKIEPKSPSSKPRPGGSEVRPGGSGAKYEAKSKRSGAGPKSKTARVALKLPPKMRTFHLSQSKQINFCLDCEICQNLHCLHTNHPRKIVTKMDKHLVDYNHGRFQSLNDFFHRQMPKVSLVDLAYDETVI